MEYIDPALERRVWSRVRGMESPAKEKQPELGLLCRRVELCADIYRSLLRRSTGRPAQRMRRLEQEARQASARLAKLCQSQGETVPEQAEDIPEVSGARKLALCLHWMTQWTQDCRELSAHPALGREFAELTRTGEEQCRLLKEMLQSTAHGGR